MDGTETKRKKYFLITIAILGVLFLIVIALVALGFVAFLFFQTPPQNFQTPLAITQPTPNVTNNEGVDETPSENPNVISVETPSALIPDSDSLWGYIQTPLVEQNCLAQAKIRAGDLAWGVGSCSCSETKSDSAKNYSCIVSALDGDHALDVGCIKSQGNCTIISEQGSFVFTFEQLYELVQ